MSLHKKRSFSLRISSVSADLVTFTEKILNGKLHFFVQYVIKKSIPQYGRLFFGKV